MRSVQLCLGTAQLGMRYGITNSRNRVDKEVSTRIIRYAAEQGFSEIDTAPGYGISEEVVGEALRGRDDIYITTKLARCNEGALGNEKVANWQRSLDSSRRKLGRDMVDCLMLHDAGMITMDGAELLCEWLIEKKVDGSIRDAGISVYDATDCREIDYALFKRVQIPASIMNQSLCHGSLVDTWRREKVHVMMRSIFMQGLLLADPHKWPDWMPMEMKEKGIELESFCVREGVSVQEACMASVLSMHPKATLIAGLTSVAEVKEFRSALEKASDMSQGRDYEWSKWDMSHNAYSDPRTWLKHSE